MNTIQHLPTELLIDLFCISLGDAVPLPAPLKRGVVSNVSHNPLNLGLVCKRWRSITFTFPALWTTINVRNPIPSDVPVLNEWLERSGQHPLDISFQESHSHSKNSAMAQILPVALQHHTRWRKLRLAISSDAEAAFSASRISSLPLLQSITIIGLGKIHPVVKDAFLSQLYGSSPALQDLKLGIKLDNNTLAHVPWERLESVDLRSVHASQLHPILKASRNLRDLNIRGVEGMPQYFVTHVELPFLQKLSVSADDALCGFFSSATLPGLTELRIGPGINPDRHFIWNSLERLLQRSGCTLRSLECGALSEGNHSSDPLMSLLWSPTMAGIHELTVFSNVRAGTVMSLVHGDYPTVHLLPELRMLTIGRMTSVDQGMVSTVMSSRSQCCARVCK
ncbi:hypothetical protein FA15DRAFT_95589 [Coprinopsis marcescibilis]|uniref:Uncharacterized protein n=1 Tax=Coprinopsis marcescibilis TaxID=230819 RepID=A0A5C3KLH9_COPMA|nr:hypothetical protein FA15DRAFT_95589 [Coprinopsis marcescibilis]